MSLSIGSTAKGPGRKSLGAHERMLRRLDLIILAGLVPLFLAGPGELAIQA
jgi:hypothetical protein